jgi:hypothetical protein
MAVTNQQSTEYAAEKGSPHVADVQTTKLKKVVLVFNFVQDGAGEATSTALLRRLPGGLCYFFPKESYITWEAFGGGRTLDIGHAAYTALNLSTVVASTALFDDDIDVASAGAAAMGSDFTQSLVANNGGFKKFESVDGVDIVATVAVDTIPDTTNLTGFLVVGIP